MLRLLEAIDFARLAPERQTIIALLKHNSNLPHCCGELMRNNAWETALRFSEDPSYPKGFNGGDAIDAIDGLAAANGSRRRTASTASTATTATQSSSSLSRQPFVRFVPCHANNRRDRFELLENAQMRMHPVSYDPFACVHKVTPDDISAVFAYLLYRDNSSNAIVSRNFNGADESADPVEMVWFRSMKQCAAVQLAVEILDSTWTGDVSEWPLARLWQTIQTGIRQDIFWVNEANKRVEPIATRVNDTVVDHSSRRSSSVDATTPTAVASALSLISPSDPMYDSYKWYYTYGYFYYHYKDRPVAMITQQEASSSSNGRWRRAQDRERSAKRTAALLLRNCSPMPLRVISQTLSSILLSPAHRATGDGRIFEKLFGCKNVFDFVRLCGDVVRLDGKNGIYVVYNCEPDIVPLPDCAFLRSHFLFNLTYRGAEASIPRLPF